MIDLILGDEAKDTRGRIRYVNDFDMSLVRRFYIIKNADTELIRGWRAHRIEQRWFYVLSGTFALDIVQVDNWEETSRNLPVKRQLLKAEDQSLLHLSSGYATALQALESDSEIIVFSDYTIESAANDDYTYPLDYFINKI